MLAGLFKLIFVPKSARSALKKRGQRAEPRPVPARRPGRERLVERAMTIYRQQREDVYEALDEETRREIEADAERAFGRILQSKD